MLQGARSLGSPLSHLPPPPGEGSRACRCLWLRPATAATLRPLQGAGRGRGERVRAACGGGAGSAGCLAHPDLGAERQRRGAGNTVGGCLSVRVWRAEPWEGETPGLIAPDCARRSATARSAAGWSRNSAARWPELGARTPRGGLRAGAGRAALALRVSACAEERALVCLRTWGRDVGYLLFLLPAFLRLSCVCLFRTAQGTLWRQGPRTNL